ncbi:MAG: carboxypeptidase-like regulatory domain-containing protein [Anaerolineae bacterium]
MMRRLLLPALAALFLLGHVVSSQADGGVVEGQVVNGTAEHIVALSGLDVQLHLFAGSTMKETRHALTDDQGMYRFENVPTGAPWVAFVVVEYAGAEYESEEIDLSADQHANANVVVYDATTLDAAIRVERRHLIVEMGMGQLEVTESLMLANDGDRTYVGSSEVLPARRGTVEILLPQGSTGVTFSSAEARAAMVRTARGLVDLRPMPPGQREYVLSYALPCPTTALSLTIGSPYPTSAIDLLLAVPGARVMVSTLQPLGTRDASGATYLYFAGRDLDRGAVVTVDMTGLGQPASERVGVVSAGPPIAVPGPRWWSLAPWLAALGLAAALAWRLANPTQGGQAGEEPGIDAGDEEARLLAAIAELDDRYDAGELDERWYRKRREQARQAALAVMAQGAAALRPSRAVRQRRGGNAAPHAAGHATSTPAKRRALAKPRGSD